VGGLAGANIGGAISGSSSNAIVNGSTYTGGLVGANVGTIVGTISNGVSSTATVTGNVFVGGLAGYNDATGVRSSSSVMYLHPIMGKRQNLEVRTDTRAHRIDGDHEVARRLELAVHLAGEQQLQAGQPRVLARGHDGAQHQREDHDYFLPVGSGRRIGSASSS